MSLIKILVVDDEDLIRDRFVKAFPFKQYGYEIVGEASNGIEALEHCRTLDIDVVITDIVMPLMDGIELTKQIKEQYSHIKVILLSCHEKFSFAQKALSLGASEYLLKANAEFLDIKKILDRLKPDILNSRSKIKNTLIDSNGPSKYARRSELVKSLIDTRTNISQEQLSKELGSYNTMTDICVVQIKICGYNRILDIITADRGIKLKTDVLTIFEELSFEQVNLYPFLWENNKLGIIITNHKIAVSLNSDTIKKIVNECHDAVENKLQVPIVCGASKIRSTSDTEALNISISEMIAESKLAVDTFFYHINNTRLKIYSKEKRFATLSSYIKEKLDFVFSVVTGEHEPIAIQDKLTTLSNTIKGFWIRPEEVIMWLIDLTNKLSSSGVEDNPNLNKIKYIESLNDIEEYLLSLIIKKKNIIQIDYETSGNPYVRSALSYINMHYHERVRVKNISDSLFISPNYLSHIFKDEIGVGIINYLNLVRIEYAAYFLSTTNDKAAVIAQNVGISDYKYFIKLFKKVKGMTPSEYRNQLDTKN